MRSEEIPGTSGPVGTTVVWFRDDLRLADNAALQWAAARGPVVGLVVDEDPGVTGARQAGGASAWWRGRSLENLGTRLAGYRVPLLHLRGDPTVIVPALPGILGAGAVVWNRRYVEALCRVDAVVKQRLARQGVEVHSFAGHLLTEPWQVRSGGGGPYRVFTPYSRAARQLAEEATAAAVDDVPGVPDGLRGPVDPPAAVPFPAVPRSAPEPWTVTLERVWDPGEEAALASLAAFTGDDRSSVSGREGTRAGYAVGRDFPGQDATSRLSPHLRHGELSPHRVWFAVGAAAERGDLRWEDAVALRTELLWRDFSWQRLYHRPDLATRCVREEFDRFPWRGDRSGGTATDTATATEPCHPSGPDPALARDLAAWRSGETGFPLVDAGMRELWATGWMHNRVRMVVASFLTKNLLIHWRLGEEWFWDTLVDADPASNPFNWQWAAGCGDDASPYFRIFNPVTQQKKFDPDGEYVGRWTAAVGDPGSVVEPVVDLAVSREEALEAYRKIRQ